MSSPSSKKARVLSSRVSYRGPVFWVTTDDVLEPTGVRARRDVVRHSGSVVVLAVDESSGSPRVLLEKQYRHAAGRFLLELPAGRIDEGEAPRKDWSLPLELLGILAFVLVNFRAASKIEHPLGGTDWVGTTDG